MRGADVFIGLSIENQVTQEKVQARTEELVRLGRDRFAAAEALFTKSS